MKKLFISILLTAFVTLIGCAGPNPVLQNPYTTNNAVTADAYVRTISRSITNGLATTNYVNTATNGLASTSYVIAATNGLASTSYVIAATNTLIITTNQIDETFYNLVTNIGSASGTPDALTNNEARSTVFAADVSVGRQVNGDSSGANLFVGNDIYLWNANDDAWVQTFSMGDYELNVRTTYGLTANKLVGAHYGYGAGLTNIHGSNSIAAGTISTNRMDATAYEAFIGGGTMTNNTGLPGVVVGSGIGTNLSSLVTVAGLTVTASYNDIFLGSGINGGSLWLHDTYFGGYGQLYYYQDAFRISTDFHVAGELFSGNGLTSDGNVTLGTNALFIGNGVAITNLNLGEITSSIIFVSTTGNDTTGNGTYEKPYQTLLKAQTVAVAGTTICVGPGQWLESDLGKDDVGWELSRGTVIGSAVDGHAPVFTAADISFVVSGFGQILATNTPVTATGSGLIVLDGAFLNYATDPIQQIQGTWRTP